jgi:hypothetical protein
MKTSRLVIDFEGIHSQNRELERNLKTETTRILHIETDRSVWQHQRTSKRITLH